MKVCGVLFVAVVGFLSALHPAKADIVTVTYTGLANGVDNDGLFGTSTSITNAPYTAVFVFDTSLGEISRAGSALFNIGGPGAFAGSTEPTPNLSASLTIGGRTVSLVGSNEGVIQVSRDTSSINVFQVEADPIGGGTINIEAFSANIPFSIETNFSAMLSPADDKGGEFATQDFTDQFHGTGLLLSDVLSVSETDAAAATPLPAALPLFATGLGALGLLGWRRKRKAQAAA